MINTRLAFLSALILSCIPTLIVADAVTGKREYDKVCPNAKPIEQEVAPDHKVTYYCDTLPPMQGQSTWNLQSIQDCAISCKTPGCRGASWTKDHGICWLYMANPNEGDGFVWITGSKAFAGPEISPADLASCEAARDKCIKDKSDLNTLYVGCETSRQECEAKLAGSGNGNSGMLASDLAICETAKNDCLIQHDICKSRLKTCEDSSADCSGCLRTLNEWETAPSICSDRSWTTRSLNGKKIITLCGYTTVAKLVQHPVTLDKCVVICSQDPSCSLVNYNKQWQACYTATEINSAGIKPDPGNDVVLLLH